MYPVDQLMDGIGVSGGGRPVVGTGTGGNGKVGMVGGSQPK